VLKAGAHAVGAEHGINGVGARSHRTRPTDASRSPWAPPKVSHTEEGRGGLKPPPYMASAFPLCPLRLCGESPSLTPSRLIDGWFEGPEVEGGEFDEGGGTEASTEDAPAEAQIL